MNKITQLKNWSQSNADFLTAAGCYVWLTLGPTGVGSCRRNRIVVVVVVDALTTKCQVRQMYPRDIDIQRNCAICRNFIGPPCGPTQPSGWS